MPARARPGQPWQPTSCGEPKSASSHGFKTAQIAHEPLFTLVQVGDAVLAGDVEVAAQGAKLSPNEVGLASWFGALSAGTVTHGETSSIAERNRRARVAASAARDNNATTTRGTGLNSEPCPATSYALHTTPSV